MTKDKAWKVRPTDASQMPAPIASPEELSEIDMLAGVAAQLTRQIIMNLAVGHSRFYFEVSEDSSGMSARLLVVDRDGELPEPSHTYGNIDDHSVDPNEVLQAAEDLKAGGRSH